MNAAARNKLGQLRSRYRHRIREALEDNGWPTLSALAEDEGLTTESFSKVLRGQGHSPRVLDRLRAEGVPERYLYDPRFISSKTTVKVEHA